MTRFFAIAVSLALSFLSLAATAATLEAIPGSAPQSTRVYAFFPKPIGVIVRSDAGAAIAGATVQFSNRALLGPEDPWVGFAGEGAGFATTDANGVALLSDGVFAGTFPGNADLMVSFPGAAPLALRLTILPGPAKTFETVSGGAQAVQKGALFASPWVVRALDANGLAVPYAYVDFDAREYAEIGHPAGATFEGRDIIAVMADAAGIATTPRPRANDTIGHGIGYVCGFDTVCTQIGFEVIDWPAPADVAFVSAPPSSIENGATAIAPFVVRVLDSSGRGLAGVPVAFVTQPDCGSFGGWERVSMISGADGLATSPRFTGVGDGIFCPNRVEVGGLGWDYGFYMYVFRPENVRMEAPRYVVTRTGRSFQVDVAFSAGGEPIYGLPVTVQVITGTHGATATLARVPSAPYESNVVTLEFNANSRDGYYAISITRGPVRTWIGVDQRKH